MSENRRLFDQFPPVSTSEWMEKIKVDLKGADFEKSMVWKPVEGFPVMPFYRSEDLAALKFIDTMPGEYPFLRGTGKTDNSWYIRQDIEVEDFAEANKKAISVLSKGVDSLCFIFKPEVKYQTADMEKLLESIFLEAIELNFAPQGAALELADAFIGVVTARGTKPALIKGAIETDPLGRYMINGRLCIPVEEGLDYVANLVKKAAPFPNLRVLGVNGSVLGDAGASAVQELGITLAMGNEYMAQLCTRNIDPDEAARSMGFTFSIGSGYFMEIAKLRAARMLWATIVKKYSPSSEDSMKMNIHSVTTGWNKTLYDPYVNMLRTQTEAMSATLGGADSITVDPFDKVYSAPGEFSERIARNQQLLLKEESHFDKIVDPSAGSYYIENLTASMAEHAWSLFLKIEEEGGFLEALKSGYIQSVVEETGKRRKTDVARGREKLLGTNIFPSLNEVIPSKESIRRNIPSAEGEPEIKPLVIARAAEEFERLRGTTDRSGRRPKVFNLTIGNLTMRKARAQFSTNFFAVAGYQVIDNTGFASVKDGVSAAVDAGADIIVLCSSDEEYELFGPEALALTGDKALLVIAGAPACSDLLKEKGIKHFISMRSNLLESLQMFNNLLGIA